MAKPTGPGLVYIVGLPLGPVKIGITAGSVRSRQQAAARETGREVAMFGSWEAQRPWLVEKFAHLYLRDFHLVGEWFDVSPSVGKKAIFEAVRLLGRAAPPIIPRTWFERAGVEDGEARRFLLNSPSPGNARRKNMPDLIDHSLAAFNDRLHRSRGRRWQDVV